MNKYPLLQSQMGVFAECVKYPQMAGYNMPYIAALPDDIDMRRLSRAWEKIIDAHPAMRNRYEITDDGEVLQYSDPEMNIPVIFRGCPDSELQDYIKNDFIRPFDLLSGEPLVRVELVTTEKGKYQLVDMHHTICDGLTMIYLINKKELPAVYAGEEPYHEAVTIYDAALREKDTFDTEEYRKVKEYYADIFSENDFATLSEHLAEEPSPMMLLSEYELDVRYITVGGEALSGVTGGKVQIINEYGPTECTNDICVYKLKRGKTYKNVPIGRPIANSSCFVIDQHGHLLPRGIAGELCYVGPQIGRGYWNREELTKKSFVECPFLEGAVMYRTGDLARYNEDGLVECLGRIDAQIKLRGFRIELEEIEENARRCEGVRFAAAAVKDISGAPHLILYYMPKEGVTVTEHVLRSQLEHSSLASYMHPEIYVNLEQMPLLPNGKIDRKSLPEVHAEFSVENVKPETAIESHFLNAAKEILGQSEFGVTDDLFTLGMTSLSAMKFVVRINSMDFHQKYRVSDVMRYRNIRAMIKGNRRIYWQYSTYDPEKPYLVFMYGIAPVAKTLQMLKTWSERFNIFVVEAIDAHYDLLFDESTVFEDVVDMYSLMLENNIPSDAHIAGLVGFSWGGMLSYRLAQRISEYRGESPFVLLGDTYFVNQAEDERQEQLSFDAYPENLFELTGGAITQHEVITKMNISIRLDNTVTYIPKYDGKVILLNAHQHADPARKKKNIRMMQDKAADLEIIDFPKHSHDDLFFDQTQVPYYLEIMLHAMSENE